MDNEDSTTPATLSDLESSLLYQVNSLIIERDAFKVKIDEIVSDSDTQISSAITEAHRLAMNALVHALGQQVEDNVVEQGVASVIFAEFANQLGKTGIWTNPYKNKYTVTISHAYSDVLTVTGIEAEDEEDAIELVKEDLTLDSPVRKGYLTYNGDGEADDTPEIEDCNDTSFDWNDFDLSFSAEQE